jgi:hypothetical protein
MDDAKATAAYSPISLSAEHSWEAAAPILYPVLRPAGTLGLRLSTITTPSSAAGNVDPLLDDGPVDLAIAYAVTAGGFDVLANGEHLASWNVSPATMRAAAYGNLAAWAVGAPWSIDASESRRVISSDTGDGWDAAGIPAASSCRRRLPTSRRSWEAGATACSWACRRAISWSRAPCGRTTRSSRCSSRTSSRGTPANPTSRSTVASSSCARAG